MLKPIRKKSQSKSIVSDFSNLENSNFKCGSIQVSTSQILFKSLNNINQLGGLPKKEEQIRIVTRKAINSFDFILAIIAQEKVIQTLYIAFYRIGKKVINELKELQNKGKITKIIFLVNDGFPKLVPDAYNLLNQYRSSNWKVKIENNHTKIILANANKNDFIIEGSGNLSINARIEQYVIDNNKQLYNFHKEWIDKI